jgi:hypothetical protein
MADTKISALTASTTPLAGTEVLPIVQSGTTKQVSVANLTAGRPISASSVTASTGNFVVGTSGQGIDFSATPGTGTSELLADYEEGTWTPNQGSGLVVVGTLTSAGFYTKVGRLVTVVFYFVSTTTVAANAGGVITTNLPFVAGAGGVGAVFQFGSFGSTCIAGANDDIVYASEAIPPAAAIDITITYFV